MDKEKVDPELQEFLEVEQQKAQLQGQVLLLLSLYCYINITSIGWVLYDLNQNLCPSDSHFLIIKRL